MNNPKGSGTFEIKYYDKRVPEEDNPVNVHVDIQEKYEKLDAFFERIFDENSLNVAKVLNKKIYFHKRKLILKITIAIVQGRKRQKGLEREFLCLRRNRNL
jgi:hypothetical protein